MSVLKKKAAHIDDRKKCLSLEFLVHVIDPNRSKLRCQGRATEVNLSLSVLIRLELDPLRCLHTLQGVRTRQWHSASTPTEAAGQRWKAPLDSQQPLCFETWIKHGAPMNPLNQVEDQTIHFLKANNFEPWLGDIRTFGYADDTTYGPNFNPWHLVRQFVGG